MHLLNLINCATLTIHSILSLTLSPPRLQYVTDEDEVDSADEDNPAATAAAVPTSPKWVDPKGEHCEALAQYLHKPVGYTINITVLIKSLLPQSLLYHTANCIDVLCFIFNFHDTLQIATLRTSMLP